MFFPCLISIILVVCLTPTNRFRFCFALTAAQFKRAVRIATGHDLSENVLDTVFKIFDLDGDNCLSHKEFLDVMHDRMLRGLKVTLLNWAWLVLMGHSAHAARSADGLRCTLMVVYLRPHSGKFGVQRIPDATP